MSVNTIFRIHRTGRPNVGTVGLGTETKIASGIMAGVFAVSTAGVTSVGYLEIRDAVATQVVISDG
jgi:hypothetical protein